MVSELCSNILCMTYIHRIMLITFFWYLRNMHIYNVFVTLLYNKFDLNIRDLLQILFLCFLGGPIPRLFQSARNPYFTGFTGNLVYFGKFLDIFFVETTELKSFIIL